MKELTLNVAGVGSDSSMLVRIDDVRPIFQSQLERIAELEKERDELVLAIQMMHEPEQSE